jgi:enoyl-[acyl-carrier-protein] reductase (NADH)
VLRVGRRSDRGRPPGIPEVDRLLDKAKAKASARSLVSIDDVGVATAFLAHDAARLTTGERSTSIVGITSWI